MQAVLPGQVLRSGGRAAGPASILLWTAVSPLLCCELSGFVTQTDGRCYPADGNADSWRQVEVRARGVVSEKKFATEAEILARLRELTQEVRHVRNEFRTAIGRAPSQAPKSKPRIAGRVRK